MVRSTGAARRHTAFGAVRVCVSCALVKCTTYSGCVRLLVTAAHFVVGSRRPFDSRIRVSVRVSAYARVESLCAALMMMLRLHAVKYVHMVFST